LCIQELLLSLYNDTNKFDERILPLLEPTNKTKFLLEIIRLSLNAKPLSRELTNIRLKVSRHAPEKWQQNTFNANEQIQNNNDLSQTELSLLQRFSTRIGKDSIFKAQPSNQYLTENAGVWVPISNNPDLIKENILPLDLKYLQEKKHFSAVADLVLRPRSKTNEVLVQLSNEKPSAINYKKRWYKIISITNPEYLSCQWWTNAVAKDYYKVLLTPLNNHLNISNNINQTILMLLTFDKLKNKWDIEGIYD
jgi:hypothetical protein